MAKARTRKKAVETPAAEPVAVEQAAPPIETHQPPAEREAAHEHGHAHRHHQHREEHQSHAQAVGKKPRYNEQGKSDYVAGVQLLEHHNPYLSVIRFSEKPSEEVRGKMREAGFSFQAKNHEWTRPINFENRQQDRIGADRLFDDVCKMIRQERGITHDFGGA